jgi:PAS domain S-box-containing protein
MGAPGNGHETGRSGTPAARDPEERPGFPVVLLAASAGGVEALKIFLRTLPADPGMALVVLTHVPADKVNLLGDVLAGFTLLPVVEADGNTPLAPDTVYTAPASHELDIEGGVLTLLPRREEPASGVINRFLAALARDQGRNAACVILSGAGSDGAAGVRHLAQAGGLVLVQDPSTALHGGMPLSAMQTGLADAVLPLEELAPALVRLMAARPGAGRIPEVLAGEILALAAEHSGQDLSGYRLSTVIRRIHKRMVLAGTPDPQEYLALLRRNPEELTRLYGSLFIGVTAFFRDPEAFRALREKALPGLFRNRSSGEPLRVWVAGCSTGEEAYSLAMLLDEYMTQEGLHRTVKIFASDIDQAALDAARQGTFPLSGSHAPPPESLDRHFQRGVRDCRVSKTLREQMVFARHNLLQDPPFLHMDLVVCRNLLIYLTPGFQARALEILASAVNPEGYLLLGSAESAECLDQVMDTVDARWRLFQRKAAPERTSQPGFTPPLRRPPPSWPWPESAMRQPPTPAAVATQALLRHLGRPAALVDKNFRILHLLGETGLFLGLAEGEPTLGLVKLARPQLRPQLRSALNSALDSGQPVRIQNLSLPEGERLNLAVDPVLDQDGGLTSLLVVFDPQPVRPGLPEPPGPVTDQEMILRYEAELRQANEELQRSVEMQERLNEELRASNEELISLNEELQSSNEEMDASREELQSLNEELTAKVAELAQSRAFAENLLHSSHVPMLFASRELALVAHTPEARDIFHLGKADQGRPLAALKPRVDDATVVEDARQAMDTLTTVERETFAPDGRVFLKRVHPFLTPEGRVEGVVLTYAEVTSLKAAEMVLRRGNEQLEALVEARTRELAKSEERLRTVADFTHDWEYWRAPDGDLLWISPSCERVSGYTAEEFMHDPGLLEGIVLPEDLPLYRDHLREEEQSAEGVRHLDFRIVHRSGRVVWLDHHCQDIRRPDGTPLGRRAGNRDITDRKNAEAEAKSWARFPQENPNPVIRVDRNLTVTHANNAALPLLESLGSGPWLPFPASLSEFVRQARPGEGVVRFEVEVGGEVLALSALAIPGEDYVNVYGLDITDRKRAETALARSEEQLRQLVESAPDAIMVQSGGRFAYVNPEAMRLFKARRPEDLLGHPVLDHIHPASREEVRERIRLANAGQTPPNPSALKYLCLDGSAVEVEALAVPYTTEKGPAGLVFARDITSRRRLEETQAEAQAEIRRQRDFLEDLVRNAPIVIGVVEGPEHRYVQANPAYEALLPEERRPLVGMTVAQAFPLIARDMHGFFTSVYATGKPVRLRQFRVSMGETLTWWDADFLPLHEDSGQVSRILIMGHQITEVMEGRRKAEAEALKNRAVIDNLAEGLVLADARGDILHVNPTAMRIYGMRSAEEIPASFRGFNGFLELSMPDGSLLPAEAWPMARAMRGDVFTGLEVRVRRTDTGRSWLARYSGSPVTSAEGEFLFSLICFEDITQAKRSEEALRASQERFRQLVETAPMVVFVQTRGRFAYVNPRALEVFGASRPEELLDTPVADRFAGEYRNVALERIRRLNEDSSPQPPLEYPIRRLDGAEAFIEVAGVPLEWEGERGALVFALEVSERRMTRAELVKARDAAEAANRAKSEFLANMSHEIRTPLNGLLGMIQLLRTTELDFEQIEYTAVAMRSGARLTRLLSDILDLSRIEAGRIIIAEAPLRLTDIMGALKDTFKPLCMEKRLSLSTTFAPGVPDRLSGDEVRIRQVLFNLVGNALKFSEAGEVRVEVSLLRPVSPERCRVLFMVEDNGVGIPDDKLGTVCDPFTQVEGSYTRTQQGAGLGLAITRRLVGLLGGTLTIESEEGRGTTIYLALPLGLPTNGRNQAGAAPAAPAGVPVGLRVLLAEDDPVNQATVRRYLEKSGCAVTAVSDGQQALLALKQGAFDCVLLDVQMPVLDGLAATRIIRQGQEPGIDPGVPVVALTAYAMSGDRERFLEAGMDAYLSKPVDLEELKRAVVRAAERRGRKGTP